MRILYIDVDSLRPDHLGCYGYHRNTSPNVDALAEEGIRFDNVYVSDAPCLPSRTATWSGRCGFRTGVVNHGGTAAQPFIEGPSRWVTDSFHDTSWMTCLRSAGYRTASVSTFAERHAAWHWYAGYNEIHNSGREGMDRADEVAPIALDWLDRRGAEDDWFLHVNFWDPHIPYRTPVDYGNPFEAEPIPDWMTEDVWRRGWEGFGPHSPQEPHGYGGEEYFLGFPRFPTTIDSMEAVKQWFDGYDVGIRYMDDHVGRLVGKLEELGVLDETAVVVSADHGESMGELNVWGDHQTADDTTCRVPLIVRWPGLTTTRTDAALHYQFDWAATVVHLAGGTVPSNWDGVSFAAELRDGRSSGRDCLVLSQCAHAAQRGVRFDHEDEAYLYLRSHHDGYKMVDPVMVFNLTLDPHEQENLSADRPDLVRLGATLLEDWTSGMMKASTMNVDPLMTVLREGPLHVRGSLPNYLRRLHATGRARHARRLAERHAGELD